MTANKTLEIMPFKKPLLNRDKPLLTCNASTASGIVFTHDTSVTELELGDRILFHGYVHRFKPSLSSNFVERFLVIT